MSRMNQENLSTLETVQAGDKIKFKAETLPYRVRCRGKRYIICTRPHNLKRTVWYSVIDLVDDVRGRENLIFGMGFETDQQCAEALERLESGDTEVSHRYRIDLDVEWIKRGAK